MTGPVPLFEDSWLRFVEIVVRALRQAATEVRGGRRTHFEGREGWFGVERRSLGGCKVPAETSISQALVEVLRGMRSRQIVEGDSVPDGLDLSRIDFEVEAPRRHERGIGKKSQRTDIRIAIVQDDLDLRIEAKNILTGADLRRHYLGRSGLGRFDDARSPYTSERFGAMLAYIMDDDGPGWEERRLEALTGATPALALRTMDIAGETMTITRHDRRIDSPEHGIAERRITDVLHLMLTFEATPPLRRGRRAGRRRR